MRRRSRLTRARVYLSLARALGMNNRVFLIRTPPLRAKGVMRRD